MDNYTFHIWLKNHIEYLAFNFFLQLSISFSIKMERENKVKYDSEWSIFPHTLFYEESYYMNIIKDADVSPSMITHCSIITIYCRFTVSGPISTTRLVQKWKERCTFKARTRQTQTVVVRVLRLFLSPAVVWSFNRLRIYRTTLYWDGVTYVHWMSLNQHEWHRKFIET